MVTTNVIQCGTNRQRSTAAAAAAAAAAANVVVVLHFSQVTINRIGSRSSENVSIYTSPNHSF